MDRKKLESLKKNISRKIKSSEVKDLIKNIDKYIERGNIQFFRHTSSHFYRRILDMHEKSLKKILNNSIFIDYLYAGLVSWRLERGDNSLIPWKDFKNQITGLYNDFKVLEKKKIEKIKPENINNIISKLENIYNKLDLKEDTDSKIVANSKLMHFILPNLVPPIDNRFTGKLYYLGEGGVKDYLRQFIFFWRLYRSVDNNILRTKKEKYRTVPKLLDNAIIGYVKLNKE